MGWRVGRDTGRRGWDGQVEHGGVSGCVIAVGWSRYRMVGQDIGWTMCRWMVGWIEHTAWRRGMGWGAMEEGMGGVGRLPTLISSSYLVQTQFKTLFFFSPSAFVGSRVIAA